MNFEDFKIHSFLSLTKSINAFIFKLKINIITKKPIKSTLTPVIKVMSNNAMVMWRTIFLLKNTQNILERTILKLWNIWMRYLVFYTVFEHTTHNTFSKDINFKQEYFIDFSDTLTFIFIWIANK